MNYLYILLVCIQIILQAHCYKYEVCPKTAQEINSKITGKWHVKTIIFNEAVQNFIMDRTCSEIIIDQINQTHFKQTWFIKNDFNTHFDLYELQMVHNHSGIWKWDNPFGGYLNGYIVDVEPYSSMVLSICNHYLHEESFMLVAILSRNAHYKILESNVFKYILDYSQDSNNIITFKDC